jgi:hypothetical protein
MKPQQSHDHHYVPQWYQRRFLAEGETSYYCLDKQPQTTIVRGVPHRHRELYNWGPERCFYEKDLYTLKLGGWTTDQVERFFFGEIDRRGREAVTLVGDYDGDLEKGGEALMDAFQNLVSYLGAQRFRTPRSLDLIKKRVGDGDHNATLELMGRLFQLHTTVWTEGIWEIVRARKSQTKFIVTDDPVTFYNRSMFPSTWVYPDDANYKEIGTRVIFPLGLDSCFIVTHLQLARNPVATPTEFRLNPRSFDQAMKYLLDIQYGRELEEDEVLRINYILKRRATRYIAAAEEEWLCPERLASTTDWTKLDSDWFLLPNLWKVPFSRGITVGYKDGSAWAADEYGHHPWQPAYKDEKLRDREWETAQLAKEEWAKRRIGRSVAHVHRLTHDDVEDEMMQEYLQNEGLLPTPTDQK